jgi:hypothetical protein
LYCSFGGVSSIDSSITVCCVVIYVLCFPFIFYRSVWFNLLFTEPCAVNPLISPWLIDREPGACDYALAFLIVFFEPQLKKGEGARQRDPTYVCFCGGVGGPHRGSLWDPILIGNETGGNWSATTSIFID